VVAHRADAACGSRQLVFQFSPSKENSPKKRKTFSAGDLGGVLRTPTAQHMMVMFFTVKEPQKKRERY